jgi:hypothetical protein
MGVTEGEIDWLIRIFSVFRTISGGMCCVVSTRLYHQRMSHLADALRAATAAALVGSFGCLVSATATADPEPNTGTSADVNTLASNLSKGYGLNNCTAQPITGAQLAALVCGKSPDPAGPVEAKYFLFANGDDLAALFKNSIKDDVLTNCGESSTKGPSPWHQGSNATTNAGQVVCGTYQDGAEIIWTTDAKKVLSYIRASNGDVPALYKWWQTNG